MVSYTENFGKIDYKTIPEGIQSFIPKGRWIIMAVRESVNMDTYPPQIALVNYYLDNWGAIYNPSLPESGFAPPSTHYECMNGPTRERRKLMPLCDFMIEILKHQYATVYNSVSFPNFFRGVIIGPRTMNIIEYKQMLIYPICLINEYVHTKTNRIEDLVSKETISIESHLDSSKELDEISCEHEHTPDKSETFETKYDSEVESPSSDSKASVIDTVPDTEKMEEIKKKTIDYFSKLDELNHEEFDRLKHENIELKELLAHNLKDLREMISSVDYSQRKMEEFKSLFTESEESKNLMKSEMDRIKVEIEDYKSQLRECQAKLEESIKEKSSINIEKEREIRISLRSEFEREYAEKLKSELEKKDNEYARKQLLAIQVEFKRIHDLKEREYQEMEERLTKDFKKTSENLNKITREFKEMEIETNEFKKNAKAKERDLNSSITTLQRAIKKYRDDLENANRRSRQQETEISELHKVIDTMDRSQTVLREEIAKLGTENKELSSRIETGSGSSISPMERESRLISELDNLKRINHSMTVQFKESRKRVSVLTDEILEVQGQLEKRNSLVEELRGQIDRLRGLNTSLCAKIKTYEREMTESKGRIELLQSEATQDFLRTESLKQQLNTISEICENLNRSNRILQEKLKASSKDTGTIESDPINDEMMTRIYDLMKENSSIRELLEESRETSKSLQRKLNDIKEKYSEMSEELANQSMKNMDLTAESKNYKEERDAIKIILLREQSRSEEMEQEIEKLKSVIMMLQGCHVESP